MKTLLLGAPVLLIACTGCTHNPQLQPEQTAPVRAEVINTSASSSRSIIDLTGIIVARQVADISSQVLAPISAVEVREGDTARKGQVLVRLASVPLHAAVEQAQAELLAAKQQENAAKAQKNLAAETYARYAILNQRHSVTPQEFDQVKTQLDAADAQLQSAAAQSAAAKAGTRQSQATSAYTVLRAPFSGIVTKKYVDAGAMASPGIPLLQIEDAREHEVDIQINENDLRNIHLGESVQVDVNGSQSRITGKVRDIVPSGDAAAHTFTVKIGLPRSRALYSGMTANVLVPSGQQQPSMTVPKTALRHRGQLDSVLALDANSVAQIRYVTLGRTEGNVIEIISGLTAEDKILAQPDDALIGHRIEAKND
jgi:RND family efflux transporter MFP subunit